MLFQFHLTREKADAGPETPNGSAPFQFAVALKKYQCAVIQPAQKPLVLIFPDAVMPFHNCHFDNQTAHPQYYLAILTG